MTGITDSGNNTNWQFTIPSSTPTTPTSHSSSGGSTQSQVNNLIAMGNYTLAREIAKQYGITIPSNTLPQVSVTPSTNSSNPTYSFTRNLKLGMKGLDVKLLQQFLNNNGFPVSKKGVGSKGRENTTFGPATKAALVRFQRANKIPATGFFGVKTRGVVVGR
jgi:peptidoglycan hydrolase-like protein with peptidoglycan-binding domain